MYYQKSRQHQSRACLGIVVLAMLSGGMTNLSLAENSPDPFRQTIEADWERQEARLGRAPGHPAAILEAAERGEQLLADLLTLENAPNLDRGREALSRLRGQLENLPSLSEDQRLNLYREIRWLNREIAFQNPLLGDSPILFLKRKRFICQMLHEYLGYYYDYEDIAGGTVCLLENPGTSLAIRDLVAGRLPKGNYTTLALSYDAKTIYFAFSERAPEKPDYYSPQRRCFHIFRMDADGNYLRQLTDGLYDDFDPCELPDGDIAFMSTRRGGFGRCHNPWEPLPTYTLHRMHSDGTGIRTLSFHETNEWHPSVLNDGRVVYTRWDYVDRSAAHFHGLWASFPDGSNPVSLFGSYTQRINACYQPRAIPGSNKIIFVAGAHHADVGGSLVVVDPSRTAFDPQTGEDDFRSLEFLTPEVCFPEAPGWPDSYFHSPWPLSENYYLVSFSFDPLPGMGPNVKQDTETGIYLFDRFGNLELLYREAGISSMYPIPLRSRPVPPRLPSVLDTKMGEEGEFLLTNVYQSLFPMPEGRPVDHLRVFQILPKSETHVANQPRLGYANAESARMLLGTVPVEKDGSAYFRVPARVPVSFQAVDAKGRAVQGMRSLTYLQPGERRGCVGCHEPMGTTVPMGQTLATLREPSRIEPGPDGSKPWSFPRLVQPILDKHCVSCHGKDGNPPDLRGTPVGAFTVSYESLKPYARWYEWGDHSISVIATKPGEMPADVSPLPTILEDVHHKENVQLSDAEWRRIYLWLDGNASFYGAYSKAEQVAQLQGEAIPPPTLQ